MSVNNIKIKSGAGFTILEMIIALFIITVGIGSAVALINQNLVAGQITASKLVASYLAQEGIELVRNLRDTNWLEGSDWLDGGLTTYSTPPNLMSIIDYGRSDLFDEVHMTAYLCLGNTGFFYYNYTVMPITKENSCNPLNSILTPYKRTISLFQNPDGNPATEDLRVLSDVKWEERGRTHSVTVEEVLYDWK